MTLETETVLDRRRLRRRLVLWRVLAVLAGVAAVAAFVTTTLAPKIGETRQIARVAIQGMITSDRAQVRLLQRLGEAEHVQGVILFINSPGGTTTGGEELFEAIRELAVKKPVVAQFGTVATSAAYIAGLAADHIVARGNTITGSVGVIFQWAEVSELMAKLGVKMNEVKSGPLKANPSPFQPLDESGRRTAEDMVREAQRWFVGLVSERRKIATATVPGLEQGRVFSGREAITHKLVDTMGGEKEARRWLEETRKIPKKLKIVDWKPRRESEWSWLRLAAAALAKVAGGESVGWATLFSDDDRLARLRLDGLVSVWQPSEK